MVLRVDALAYQIHWGGKFRQIGRALNKVLFQTPSIFWTSGVELRWTRADYTPGQTPLNLRVSYGIPDKWCFLATVEWIFQACLSLGYQYAQVFTIVQYFRHR